MKTTHNCMKYFFGGIGLFLVFSSIISCEERRQGIDYRFNEKSEGWYFLIYEQEGARELEVVLNRIQVEYQKGERLVTTSSSPDFGWAQDKFYLNGKEVRSSSLGGVHPSRFVKIKEAGKTLKYKEFYLGDFKNIDRYGDPDKVLEKLLSKYKQKK